jgi:hypothetical protein
MGPKVFKSLGCSQGDKIYMQNEFGREMGFGVGDSLNANKFEEKYPCFSLGSLPWSTTYSTSK